MMNKIGLIYYLVASYNLINLKKNLNPKNYTIMIFPPLSYYVSTQFPFDSKAKCEK